MICRCDTCKGAGSVQCDDCNGLGEFESEIETAVLDKSSPDYEQLKELQGDARRVISQARRLTALKPERAAAYADQLACCLRGINAQAAKVEKEGAK